MNKRTKIGLIIGVVAVVLIVGLILLLVFLPSGNNEDTYTPLEFNTLKATVDEDGLRTIEVPVDEDGKVKENVSGSLIDLQPSYLKEIIIENSAGNYEFLVSTDSDGATTYVLKGFEDYELNNTNTAMIGSAISKLQMVAVVDVTGESKSDYGFDEPEVKATALFTDGTKATVYIGDDAPGVTNKYVMIEGCDSVFSVLKTDIDPLCLNINDMFPTSIRSDYTTVSDEDFTSIVLGGTHLKEEVTLEHAPDGSLNAYYVLASHDNQPVNSTWGSDIVGSIKSLSAESVAFANPDAETLKSLGLDNPYATVKAEYVYDKTSEETGETVEETLKVSMICSEPDADGKVYLMDEGGKVIYKIATDSVDWSVVTFEDLRSEYVFAPSYSAIKSMTVTKGSESYTFDMDTVVSETEDPETGEMVSTSESTVTYNGKSVDEAYFRILFEDMAYIPARGTASASEKGDDVVVSVTYEYTTDRAADTVVFYATDSQKVVPEVNSVIDCYIYKSDVEGIIDNAKALSEGKEIQSILG